MHGQYHNLGIRLLPQRKLIRKRSGKYIPDNMPGIQVNIMIAFAVSHKYTPAVAFCPHWLQYRPSKE
jgi:hypothetical protein